MSRSQCRFSLISCMFYTFIPTWKWKLLSRVWLFVTPMDYTVHGILQARILEWVAYPSSSGSSQPKDRTQVSRIEGRFSTDWAIREALCFLDEIYSDVFWSILENFTCALEKNACFTAFGWNVATLNMFPRIRPVKSTLPSRLFDFFFHNLCAHQNLMKSYLYQKYNPAWFLHTVKLGKYQSGTSFLTFSSWKMRLYNYLYWVL